MDRTRKRYSRDLKRKSLRENLRKSSRKNLKKKSRESSRKPSRKISRKKKHKNFKRNTDKSKICKEQIGGTNEGTFGLIKLYGQFLCKIGKLLEKHIIVEQEGDVDDLFVISEHDPETEYGPPVDYRKESWFLPWKREHVAATGFTQQQQQAGGELLASKAEDNLPILKIHDIINGRNGFWWVDSIYLKNKQKRLPRDDAWRNTISIKNTDLEPFNMFKEKICNIPYGSMKGLIDTFNSLEWQRRLRRSAQRPSKEWEGWGGWSKMIEIDMKRYINIFNKLLDIYSETFSKLNEIKTILETLVEQLSGYIYDVDKLLNRVTNKREKMTTHPDYVTIEDDVQHVTIEDDAQQEPGLVKLMHFLYSREDLLSDSRADEIAYGSLAVRGVARQNKKVRKVHFSDPFWKRECLNIIYGIDDNHNLPCFYKTIMGVKKYMELIVNGIPLRNILEVNQIAADTQMEHDLKNVSEYINMILKSWPEDPGSTESHKTIFELNKIYSEALAGPTAGDKRKRSPILIEVVNYDQDHYSNRVNEVDNTPDRKRKIPLKSPSKPVARRLTSGTGSAARRDLMSKRVTTASGADL